MKTAAAVVILVFVLLGATLFFSARYTYQREQERRKNLCHGCGFRWAVKAPLERRMAKYLICLEHAILLQQAGFL